MRSLTRDVLKELAAHRNGPMVSILMPTNPVAEGPFSDPLRLKNFIGKARAELLAAGMRGPDADAFLERARALLDDETFFRQAGRGLAVYLSEGFYRTYRTATELPEIVALGDEFVIRPLLPMIQGNGKFYVLALSAKENRLLCCTRDTVQRVALPTAPADVKVAERFVNDSESRPRGVGPTSVGGRTIFFGYGVGLEERWRNEIVDYMRQVDEALRPFLAGEKAPLVFAGTERNVELFGRVTSYPRFERSGVLGNPDLVSDKELRDGAWPIVASLFLEEERQDAERYLIGRVRGSVSRSITEVLPAAVYGRIDTLFLSMDAHLWGRFNEETGVVEVHTDVRPGDNDLLNEVAVRALMSGATVYALKPEELPEANEPVNAILRW